MPKKVREEAERLLQRIRRHYSGDRRKLAEPEGPFQTIACHGFDIPIVDDDKVLFGMLCLAIDASDRRRLETQLLRAQRMETLGRLAAGVVHDFNNLLTIINGYADLLLQSCDGDDSDRELIAGIHKAGQRCTGLTHQLLDFGRQQPSAGASLNLNDVVRDNSHMIRRVLGEHVVVDLKLDPSISRVFGDFGQFEQVLVNLVINARDAMPNGGRLTIQTANAHPPAEGSEPIVGGQVIWTIADTGAGMPYEVRKKIFEPFFTTKGPGDGTGLGLAMVMDLVQRWGGTIDVDSEVNCGSIFRIALPRHEAGAQPEDEAAARERGRRLSPAVLLVEKREEERAEMRRVLQEDGCMVLEAADAHEAIDVCARSSNPIQLLITEVTTPGVGGRVLAHQLRLLLPQMGVLYTTPLTEESGQSPARSKSMLKRPFTSSTVIDRLHEALADAHAQNQ
jgi:signal transduction histidine kinase